MSARAAREREANERIRQRPMRRFVYWSLAIAVSVLGALPYLLNDLLPGWSGGSVVWLVAGAGIAAAILVLLGWRFRRGSSGNE
jgi:hypothetical protein